MSRVTDSNPPDKVDDGEAPAHRFVDTPDADAREEKIGHRPEKHHQQAEGHGQSHKPEQRRAARQDDRTDLVGDRRERVPRLDDWRLRVLEAHAWPRSISGLGLRSAARYVVRGRVFKSVSNP